MLYEVITGDEMRALQGEETLSEAKGSLGSSVRVISPLYYQGRQVGAIAVGVSTNKVKSIIAANLWFAYMALLFGALIGAIGAYYLARKIKAMMFGLEPSEIASLFEQRSAILQSIREGVIAVNEKSEITLINAEAKRLLKLNGSFDELRQDERSKSWSYNFV